MKVRAWTSLLAVLLAGLGLQVAQTLPASAAPCTGFSVTGISPSIGFVAGGASTTIAGCGFMGSGTLSVVFGSVAATSVTISTDTSLAVTAPAATAPGDVTVTVRLHPSSGSDSTGTTTFSYLSPPAISSIIPTSGAEKGGTAVHVTGTDLSPAGSTTSVNFGTTAAPTVANVTSTTVTATSPAGTGTKNVTVVVTLPGGAAATSNGEPFKYIPAPTVTSVAPSSGPVTGGTDVTVTGTAFQPGANVFFGPSDGSVNLNGDSSGTPVSVLSPTSILVTTRAGVVGATNVVVVNPDGQSGALLSTDAKAFSFTGTAPSITSVAPVSGSSLGGTAVTITGAGFIPGASVAFAATAETSPPTATSVSVSPDGTQITATSPPHAAGLVNVIVNNVGGGTATATGAYTYNAVTAPTVTGVVAATGSSLGGTKVTVSGTNLASGTKVSFGGTAAASAATLNATTIQATTPAHAAGAVAVVVTLPDGQSATLASGFTFTGAAAPTITSVTPNTGPGGTEIAIAGSGFANTNGSTTNAVSPAIVSVGAAACVTGSTTTNTTCLQPVAPTPPALFSPPIVLSTTSIQGLVPNVPGGSATVTVTNPDGQTATGTFTYTGPTGPPTLTGITPATGTTLGGTAVSLTGTQFVQGAAVTFGSAPAANGSVTVSSDGKTITATTPPGVYGVVDVTVTNPGGLAATLTDGFTFTVSGQPTITSITPSTGPSGTQVTITGTGFASMASVTIGGQPLLPLAPTGSPPTFPPVVVNPTTITGIVPTASGGTVDVAVLNPDGQGAILTGGYSYPTDTTAPTVTASGMVGGGTYTFGAWANGHVTVTLKATDAGSGVKNISYSATGAQTITLTTVPSANVSFPITAEGTTTISYSASDVAGNVTATQTQTVKIDTIAPALSATATVPSGGGTTAYVSGTQTNQNVTVTLSCSDAGSGVATLSFSSAASMTSSGTNPLSVTVTSVGTNQAVTGTCTDVAGNVSTTTFGGIDISRTAPTIMTSATTMGGQPYTAGTWTDQAVTVTFTCTPISISDQVVSLTAPVQVSGPTQNDTVAGTCVDAAGNSSTVTFGTLAAGIDIDLTLPVATATATTTKNGATVPYVAGTWANSNVVVTFHCTDSGPNQSGVASIDPPMTVTAQGTTAGVVGGCQDVAGNTANPPAFFGPILIDKTAPVCTAVVSPNPLSPANSKLVTVRVTVTVTDAQSGAAGFKLISVSTNNPATAASDIAGFTTGTASTTGQLRSTKGRVYTFTYQGTDIAGNTSALCTAQVTVR